MTSALTLLSSQLDFICVGVGCFQLCTTLHIEIMMALMRGISIRQMH